MTSFPRTALRRALPAALLAVAATLAGCGGEPDLSTVPQSAPSRPPLPAYDGDGGLPAAAAVLALVPATAVEVMITDFDESRATMGVPELTSESPVGERAAYWDRAPGETVLLTDGLLRRHESRLLRDFGFTQDDVDWEAHWSGPDGSGWALALRPDLDMARVREAVRAEVGPLAGASVDAARHLVSAGIAAEDVETWGDREAIRELVPRTPAESAYYHAGCLPLVDVLGPDGEPEDQQRVLARHDVEYFADLDAFSLSFSDGNATARLGRNRPDAMDRTDLAAGFPRTGPLGWRDAFAVPVNDPESGRLGWRVSDAELAARLTLSGTLPFAVCSEVEPMAQ